MADILKPLYGNVWAEEGEKLSPGNTKIAAGWVQEMMPYQYENFLQNRSDVAISYLLQKGIPEYSIEQEYTANKSVVTYNSQLYMATATVTGVVPTTTASWKRLTISFGVNGAVPISFGGTGATTASEARTNLGVGTSATADFPVANGLIVKLAGNTLAARTISGTSGYITVSNGDGVSGNPTINVGANVAKTDADAAWSTKTSIKIPSGTSSERGVGAPGRIRFNMESGVYEGYDNTSWNPIGSTGTLDVQNFSGDGVKTSFTMSTTPRSENNTQVYFNGVYQQKNSYNLVGSDLVFDEAPALGIEIEVVTVSSVAIGTTTAAQTSVVDSGNYYVGTNVEQALAEAGNKQYHTILTYDTKTEADAAAATLPDDQFVDVEGEEKRYIVEAGSLVFFKNFLRRDLAGAGGSALVGYDGGTAQDVLDGLKPIANYIALRAYTGRATGVRITEPKLAGYFAHDASDTTSADDGGIVIVSADGRRWKRLYDGAISSGWFSSVQAAVTAAGSGETVISSDVSLSNVQLSSGSVRGIGGNIISTTGANPAFKLGYNKDSDGLWRYRSLRDIRISVSSGGVGISYGDTGTTQYSGRWALENISINGGAVGISKPSGNIGNTYKNVSVKGADIGFKAVASTSGTLMHAGGDNFLGGEFAGNTSAAFFIDQSVADGGQTILDSVVIEENPGCGVAVFNWATSWTPLVIRNTWFEANATAASVTLSGVTSAPYDLWLRNSRLVQLENSNARKVRVDLDSTLHMRGVTFNQETDFTIGDDCIAIADEINFTRSNTARGMAAYVGIQVNSVADVSKLEYGQYAMLLPFTPRSKVAYSAANGNVLAKRSFSGSGAISVTGSTTITSTQVYGGGALDYAAQFTLPSGGMWFLHDGTSVLTPGKWYVYFITARRISGVAPSLIFANTIQLSPDGAPFLAGTDWVTMAGVTCYTGASGGDGSARMSTPNGAATVQLGATALVEFTRKQDAIAFLNSGALIV